MAGDVGREGEQRAYRWSAREIARRNQAATERPLSPVMKTAVTACELAHGQAAQRPRD
jgi:hypothetical protein